MPTVTVLGANNSTVTLTFNSTDTANAAQAVTNAIVTNIQSGALTPVTFTGAPLPTQSNAALIVGSSGGGALLNQPAGYNAIVDTASSPIAVIGNAGAQQQIVVLLF